MKKLLLILLLTTVTGKLFAQVVPAFDQYKFNADSDYKVADSIVLQTANYLLSTPIDQNESTRLKAGHFVMQWVEGTPNYTFALEQNAIRYLSDNVDLMLLYVTSMAKYALVAHSNDPKANTINGVKVLLTYINNSANNVKMDKSLKRLSDANDKGKLERFLNL
jgi:hypothetical protein